MTEEAKNGLITGLLCTYGEVGKKTISNKLAGFYGALDCDTIYIISRRFGERYFDIVIDDEGLFKDKKQINAVSNDGHEILFGNIFICNHDEEGNSTSLTQEELDYLQKFFKYNKYGLNMNVDFGGGTIVQINSVLLKYDF